MLCGRSRALGQLLAACAVTGYLPDAAWLTAHYEALASSLLRGKAADAEGLVAVLNPLSLVEAMEGQRRRGERAAGGGEAAAGAAAAGAGAAAQDPAATKASPATAAAAAAGAAVTQAMGAAGTEPPAESLQLDNDVALLQGGPMGQGEEEGAAAAAAAAAAASAAILENAALDAARVSALQALATQLLGDEALQVRVVSTAVSLARPPRGASPYMRRRPC